MICDSGSIEPFFMLTIRSVPCLILTFESKGAIVYVPSERFSGDLFLGRKLSKTEVDRVSLL